MTLEIFLSRKLRLLLALPPLACALIWAADWPTQSGSPQREGWAKSERILSRNNVADLRILYHVEPQGSAPLSLSAPIVDGNLITYKGFKEMLVFSANSNRLFSVDADLNKLIWQSHFDAPASAKGTCQGESSSPVLMAGSSSATLHFAPPPGTAPLGANGRRRRSPYFPPLSQSLYPLLPTTLTQLNAMYTVSGDGALHVINSSTGEDLLPPTPFIPAAARVTGLNLHENVVYATAADPCDGRQNALYAVDLLSSDKHVSSFVAPRGGISGLGGTSLAPDGTVFVQVDSAPYDKPGHTHQSVVALDPKSLKVKDYFTPKLKELGKKAENPGITPLVFAWRGKNLVIAGFADGRLYLLNAASLGGPDHQTPAFRTEPVSGPGKKHDRRGFRGAFASWPDVDTGRRWFYAPVSGPLESHILAFRLDPGNDGQPEVAQVWTSPGLISPAPPVVANGLVFALATGNPPRPAKSNRKPRSAAEKKAAAGPAVLHAFDAVTGRELYSSSSALSSPAQANGLAVANGRIYFSGADGRVYCFGLPKTQPQLAEH